MSRIRSIKPDFWSSAQVMAVSRDARQLFIGIWTFADDVGRFRWEPLTLKAQVFPGDVLEASVVASWLAELSSVGLLEEYRSAGKSYGRVTGWHHQKINNPSKSKYPDPDTNAVHSSSPTVALPEPYLSPQHGSSPLGSSGIQGESAGARPPLNFPDARPANDQGVTSARGHAFGEALRAEAFAADLSPTPRLNNTHQQQAVARAIELSLSQGVSFEAAAQLLIRTALAECKATKKQLGFVLLECVVKKPERHDHQPLNAENLWK